MLSLYRIIITNNSINYIKTLRNKYYSDLNRLITGCHCEYISVNVLGT